VSNVDPESVTGFGREWAVFDQSGLSEHERLAIFGNYFRIFPWPQLPPDAMGADIGCGSGRWALLAAPRVGILHCVDASGEALAVARRNLANLKNVRFHQCSLDALPFPDHSLDFAYALGVLHHVPDTAAGLKSVATKLRPGAPFLMYLYYAFDNRPAWYRGLWRASDWIRTTVSRTPFRIRYFLSYVLALLVYWPLARVARALERYGRLPANWPLAYYRNRSFYIMRTDALDRFGTRLECRFTKEQIEAMLKSAGFQEIRFSDTPPYWCVVATPG
jgi:ubiquinone/menaquinone biosynthesis C-methylase UbiE